MKQSNSPVTRTPEQKKEIIQKIDQARKEGLTADQARAKVGISHSQYYAWRLGGKKTKVAKLRAKPKARKAPPSKVMNFTIPEAVSEQLVILIGSQVHVSQALTQLAQIRGRT